MKRGNWLRGFGLLALLGLVWFFAQSKIASKLVAYTDKPIIILESINVTNKPYDVAQNAQLLGVYQLKTQATDQLVGLSDLIYRPDGLGLLSDQGLWFETKKRDQNHYEISKTTYLADREGRDWSDSEDVAFDEADHHTYISFEREHRLKVYDQNWQDFQTFTPSGLTGLKGNQGMEGLAIGRNHEAKSVMMIASEKGDFFICPNFSPRQIVNCSSLTPPSIPPRFRPVSLEALQGQDGWLILYRSFDFYAGVKTILIHARLTQNGWQDQSTLLRIEKGYLRDNYEGVSALKTAKGYEIALISDPLATSQPPRLMIISWQMP